MIVLDGTRDEIIEGKIYHVTKGDVIVLSPNIVDGAQLHLAEKNGQVSCLSRLDKIA
jgi:hypothetical protein